MRFWFSVILLSLVIYRSMRDGGLPEKYASTAFGLSFLAEYTWNDIVGLSDFRAFSPFRLGLDGTALIVLVWVALKANRWWPIWLSALQLIVVAGHLAAYLKIPAVSGVYWGMTAVPFYPQLIILLFGIIRHKKRITAVTRYPDWSKMIE